jgi:cytoskeletal protein RodZ
MSVYQLMLRGFLGALICSFVVIAHVHPQEVIVARETKPETAKPATPSPEQIPSEPPGETPKKSKSRENKASSKSPTLEEMRMSGARAAERLNNPTPSSAVKPAEPESETATTGAPALSATAAPVKKETREQKSASHRSGPRDSKPDSVGAVRPSMIESGRQEPSGTPLPKWQASSEQTPAP